MIKKAFGLSVLLFLSVTQLYAGFNVGSRKVDTLGYYEHTKSFDTCVRGLYNVVTNDGDFSFATNEYSAGVEFGFPIKQREIIAPSHVKLDLCADINDSMTFVFTNSYEHILGSLDFIGKKARRKIVKKSQFILLYGSIGYNLAFCGEESRLSFGPAAGLTLKYWVSDKVFIAFGAEARFDFLWLTDDGINNVAKSDYSDKLHAGISFSLGFR